MPVRVSVIRSVDTNSVDTVVGRGGRSSLGLPSPPLLLGISAVSSFIVMAYIVMAHLVMAYTIMAYIVMAYIAMAF